MTSVGTFEYPRIRTQMKRNVSEVAREQLSGSGRRHAHAPARGVRMSETLKMRMSETLLKTAERRTQPDVPLL